MKKRSLSLLAGFLLALMILLPVSSFADMSVTYTKGSPGGTYLVHADGKTMLVSENLSRGDLPAWLSDLQITTVDLWVIHGTGTDLIAHIQNILSSFKVQDIWALQGKNNQVLIGMLSQSGIEASEAVQGRQYDLGGGTVTVLAAGEAGLSLRVDYGKTGFASFSSAGLIGGLASTLKPADVWFLGGDVSGNEPVGKNLPAFAAVESGYSANAASSSVAGQLNKGSVGVIDASLDSVVFVSDGTQVHLSGTELYGVILKNKVNVRSSPSVNAKRVTGLSKNKTVMITGSVFNEDHEKWMIVDLNGQTAYIRGDLIAPLTQEQLLALKTAMSAKTPKPTVDTVSGGTKKGN